ncbi:MAG: GDYXXLXY domain-containing protein [Blastocatellia bacterium]
MNRQTIFFIAAVLVQTLILAAVPARRVYTLSTGRSVVLKVAPVDPYNVLSGYYVTLGYEISRPESFPNATRPQTWAMIYAVVEKGSDGIWHPVSLEKTLPQNLPPDRAVLRGRMEGWRIVYGIEEFYIPETKRTAIADDLNKHSNAARVEVKVDAQGGAALERLLIEDRVYE